MASDSKDKSNNCIKQIAVRELFNGCYFFIPSYQRGYRWGKKQIIDLCNDLLEYSLRKPSSDIKTFYSLQPLIVRKNRKFIDGIERDVYEVIDGQQRLTSIMILYRFLIHEKGYKTAEEYSRKNNGKQLYHIYYETRPNDYKVLEKLGFSDIDEDEIIDIDIAHIYNAYQYINEWMYPSDNSYIVDTAKSTYGLYKKISEYSSDNLSTDLFRLLNNIKDTDDPLGNVQFIWYELQMEKDPIREFLSENKGKIQLTNTEKIRALFMQRKNSDNIGTQQQLSIAKDWELIENTLHKNDFWAFISDDFTKEDGRISVIFQYLYDMENPKSANEEKDDDYLYRFFNDKLNKLSSESDRNRKIADTWKEVMACFRMLQNWFNFPQVYNLVGLLTNLKNKSPYRLKDISDIYKRETVNTTEDFLKALYIEIYKCVIKPIRISKGSDTFEFSEEDDFINLSFKNKDLLHDLFLFLNVWLMQKTIRTVIKETSDDNPDKRKSDADRSTRDIMCHIYRFPFDAIKVFHWDIEHIDSYTTNSLKKPQDLYEWISKAIEEIGDELKKDDDYNKLIVGYNNINPEDVQSLSQDVKANILEPLVTCIKRVAGEEDDEDRKNWVGNLTLLDSGTNKSYKNWIFAKKNRYIKKRINDGIFVPLCTQTIFRKELANNTKALWKWEFQDKKAYHKFILDEINEFKKKYQCND